jgi:predicted Zn-dependent protease with MMP-like domain/Tfp pilus assembly protein PilF
MSRHGGDTVDRGWELLEEGDLAGAAAALASASRRDPEDPEVLCLAGAIAATEGDTERAIELSARAAEADPEYCHPLLQAGELELYSRGDAAAALELATRALEVAQGADERADVLLLRAEAEISLEPPRDEAARATLAALEALEPDDPSVLTRCGQIHLALGDAARAERAFLAAIEEDPEQADAHHGLGMIYEDRGDRPAMVKAWLDTLRLDRAAPPPPWHLSLDQFEKIAEEAMAELPDEVIRLLENVPVLIEDQPSADLVEEGYDPRLLGLFSGVPLPHKSNVSGQAPVIDSIHLYQSSLERETADVDELAEQIRITVLHETAHFFGLEDDDLHEIGLG